MRTTTILSTAAIFAGALAQTPPGFFPFQSSTANNLGVQYGPISVTPNALLARDSVSAQPVISSNTSYPGTYIVLFVDESIPKSRFPADQSSSLNIGLGANFTTRLHWWAGNITQSPDHTFTNSSPAIAPYNGPMPPLGDLPHTYVFYLFPQPAGFLAPTNVNYSISSSRMNFSVEALGSAVQSGPLAANYFRTEFPGNNVTSSNGTATSGPGSNSTASSTPSPPIPFNNTASSVSMGASAILAGAGVLLFSMF